MTYQKLVRDKIPDIIEKSGEQPIIRVLDGAEYKKELLRKLVEEAVELEESSGDIGERADIAEVLRALDEAFDLPASAVEEARRAKARDRGDFGGRIYLEGVE